MPTQAELEDQLLSILQTSSILQENPDGSINRDQGFENIKLLLCLAVILDDDFIFPIIKESADNLSATLRENLSTLEKLLSVKGLFGLGQTTITSTSSSNLSDAAFKVSNVVSSSTSEDATKAIDALNKYLKEDLIDKQVRGNTQQSLATISDVEKALSFSWEKILENKTKLLNIASNFDPKTFKSFITSILLPKLRASLNFGTEEIEASFSNDIDTNVKIIALMESLLEVVYTQSIDTVVGTTVIPAADTNIGDTPFERASLQGEGFLDFTNYVAKGINAGAYLDSVHKSTQGATAASSNLRAEITGKGEAPFNFTGINGNLVFEVDGTLRTKTFTQSSFNPISNVSAASLVTFLNSGQTYLIASTSGNKIILKTSSQNGTKSSIFISPASSESILGLLGFEANTFATGTSTVTRLTDSTVSNFTSVLSGSGPYYLLTQIASPQEITNITTGYIDVDNGLPHSTTNINYVIVNSIPGTLLYEGSELRKFPSRSYIQGEQYPSSPQLHFVGPKTSGVLADTRIRIPLYSGTTWNGLGTAGFFKPHIKTTGTGTNVRVQNSVETTTVTQQVTTTVSSNYNPNLLFFDTGFGNNNLGFFKNISYSGSSDSTNRGFEISFWVYFKGTVGGHPFALFESSDFDGSELSGRAFSMQFYSSTEIRFNAVPNSTPTQGTNNIFFGNLSISQNTWHHIYVSYNGVCYNFSVGSSQITLRLNGVDRTSTGGNFRNTKTGSAAPTYGFQKGADRLIINNGSYDNRNGTGCNRAVLTNMLFRQHTGTTTFNTTRQINRGPLRFYTSTEMDGGSYIPMKLYDTSTFTFMNKDIKLLNAQDSSGNDFIFNTEWHILYRDPARDDISRHAAETNASLFRYTNAGSVPRLVTTLKPSSVGSSNNGPTNASGSLFTGNSTSYVNSADIPKRYFKVPTTKIGDYVASETAFSISFWNKNANTNLWASEFAQKRLITVWDNSSPKEEIFYLEKTNNPKYRLVVKAANGQVNTVEWNPTKTSNWEHVVLTWSGTASNLSSNVVLYENGSPLTPSSTTINNTSDATIPTVSEVYLLAQDTTGKKFLDNHYIHSIMVFGSKELSSSEVTTLYNGGAVYGTISSIGGTKRFVFYEQGSTKHIARGRSYLNSGESQCMGYLYPEAGIDSETNNVYSYLSYTDEFSSGQPTSHSETSTQTTTTSVTTGRVGPAKITATDGITRYPKAASITGRHGVESAEFLAARLRPANNNQSILIDAPDPKPAAVVPDVKVGDYIKITSAFSGIGVTPPSVTGTYRIRAISEFSYGNADARMKLLPLYDYSVAPSPPDPSANPNGYTDVSTWSGNTYFEVAVANHEIDFKVLYAHKFRDANADYFTSGVSPGDYMIYHHSSTAVIKVFEIAGVNSKTELMLNTGWSHQTPLYNDFDNARAIGGNLYDTPKYVKGEASELPSPFLGSDNFMNQVVDGADKKYFIQRRGFKPQDVTIGSSTAKIFFGDSYYALQTATGGLGESGIVQGDVVKIWDTTLKVTNPLTGSTIQTSSDYGSTYADSAVSDTIGTYTVFGIFSENELSVYKESTTSNSSHSSALTIAKGFEYHTESCTFSVHTPDYKKLVRFKGGGVLDGKVEAGHTVKVSNSVLTRSGSAQSSYNSNYTVDSVIDDEFVKITSEQFTQGEARADLIIPYGVTTFVDNTASFQSDEVVAGDVLVMYDSSANSFTERNIVTVVSQTEITVSVTLGSPFLENNSIKYLIRRGLTDGAQKTDQFSFTDSISLSDISGIGQTMEFQGIERDLLLKLGGTYYPVERTGGVGADTDSVTTFLKLKSDVPVSSYNYSYDSSAEKITVVPSSTSAWQLHLGKQTRFLTDSGYTFSTSDLTSDLILFPGAADEFRTSIVEVDTSTNTAKLSASIEKPDGATSVNYALVPNDYPNAGMEVICETFKGKILEIKYASSAHQASKAVLRLDRPFPARLMGKAFYIVNAGDNPYSAKFTAQIIRNRRGELVTGGFGSEDIVGQTVSFAGKGLAQINLVESENTIRLQGRSNFADSETDFEVFLTRSDTVDEFQTAVDVSSVTSGDTITVWNNGIATSVISKASRPAFTEVTSSSRYISGRQNENFVVVRGGPIQYGNFLLFKYFVEKITFKTTTFTLSNLLVEASIQKGADYTASLTTANGSLSGTASVAHLRNENNTTSTVFTLNTNDAASINFQPNGNTQTYRGHRLTVRYRNTENGNFTESVSWVIDALSARSVRLFVALPVSSSTKKIVHWKLESGSVTNAIVEAFALHKSLQDFQKIMQQYNTSDSLMLQFIRQLLQDQGYDRALDTLLSGDLTSFLSLTVEDASYTDFIKKGINNLGGKIL